MQTPTSAQNDRVYANVAVKRDVPVARLLKGRKHFYRARKRLSLVVATGGGHIEHRLD